MSFFLLLKKKECILSRIIIILFIDLFLKEKNVSLKKMMFFYLEQFKGEYMMTDLLFVF